MKLQDWFIEKDYGIGVALLGTLSKNRILIQNLSRKKNPAKLEYELRKIAKEKGIDLTVKVEDQTPEEGDIITDEATGITYKFTNGEFVEYKEGDEPGKVATDVKEPRTDGKPDDKKESHSDQVIDQMNADKLKELESDANEIVSDKLSGLESDAEDIVSDNVNDLKSTAQDIVEDKISEFETQVDEIMAGKLEVIRNGRKVKFENLSPEMQVRWTQNKDAYKEIRALHEKLKLMEKATPEDRQPLTQRICDLDDQIRNNWVEIDAYVPAPAGSADEAPVIDHKRIQSNRKYISTNLKKLPEQQDPVKTAKVVAELQKRYDELKTAKETVSQETIDELVKAGVIC